MFAPSNKASTLATFNKKSRAVGADWFASTPPTWHAADHRAPLLQHLLGALEGARPPRPAPARSRHGGPLAAATSSASSGGEAG